MLGLALPGTRSVLSTAGAAAAKSHTGGRGDAVVRADKSLAFHSLRRLADELPNPVDVPVHVAAARPRPGSQR